MYILWYLWGEKNLWQIKQQHLLGQTNSGKREAVDDLLNIFKKKKCFNSVSASYGSAGVTLPQYFSDSQTKLP